MIFKILFSFVPVLDPAQLGRENRLGRFLKRSGGTMPARSPATQALRACVPPVPFATVCGSLHLCTPPHVASHHRPHSAYGFVWRCGGLLRPPVGGWGVAGLPPLLTHSNWGRIAPKPPPQGKKPAEKAVFFPCSNL